MANVILKKDAHKRLQLMYGESFPNLADKDISGKQWQDFFGKKREEQAGVQQSRRLHWSRHRNFLIGNQWISTKDGKTWKEPGSDRNTVRPVDNHVGPAAAFRHGVIAEQKPGFRHDLLSGTIKAREKAEAQQATAEHYFKKLKLHKTVNDALYHATPDGVSFVQVWLDPLAGRKMKNAVMVKPDAPNAEQIAAQGYTQDEKTGAYIIPLSDDGSKQLGPEEDVGEIAEGDLACRVVLAHDTLVDPEARMLNGGGADAAKWFLIRRPREVFAARLETGNDQLTAESYDAETDPMDFPNEMHGNAAKGLPPFPVGRQKFKECVYDYTIYIAPNGQDIEQGMWRRVIGDTIVDEADELPGLVIPFARFTDGSDDPSFYPRPIMSDWMGDQVAINAIRQLIMQHGRILGIGRILALKGTMLTETYNAIIGSVLEYEGIKPERMDSTHASVDLWKLLEYTIKKLEDKTGFNDMARGSVLGQSGGGMQDVSGRAVLGAMEQLQRTFGPMVQAAAEGASELAEIIVKYAAWTFGDTPRQIESVGGRGDLAKLVSRKEIEGECEVYCDAATMMPMPAQLRQQMLDSFLDKGRISLATWSKRSPYAETRNVHMGDLDHWQRAQAMNTQLEERWQEWAVEPEPGMEGAMGMPPAAPAPMDPAAAMLGAQPPAPAAMPAMPTTTQYALPQELYSPETGLPIFWQDDPAAHLQVLNEIILDEGKEWPLRKLAIDRSTIYEQLAQAKADPLQPVPGEVTGIPLNRLLNVLPIGGAAAPGGLVPQQTGQSAVVSPSDAAANPLASAPADTAEPLGTLGAIEEGMRQ